MNDCDPDALLGPTEYLDLVALNESQAREEFLSFVLRERVDRVKRQGEVERSLFQEPNFPGLLSRTQPRSSSWNEVKGVEVLYVYAPQDEGGLIQLDVHLAALKRVGRIATWHKQNIHTSIE